MGGRGQLFCHLCQPRITICLHLLFLVGRWIVTLPCQRCPPLQPLIACGFSFCITVYFFPQHVMTTHLFFSPACYDRSSIFFPSMLWPLIYFFFQHVMTAHLFFFPACYDRSSILFSSMLWSFINLFFSSMLWPFIFLCLFLLVQYDWWLSAWSWHLQWSPIQLYIDWL